MLSTKKPFAVLNVNDPVVRILMGGYEKNRGPGRGVLAGATGRSPGKLNSVSPCPPKRLGSVFGPSCALRRLVGASDRNKDEVSDSVPERGKKYNHVSDSADSKLRIPFVLPHNGDNDIPRTHLAHTNIVPRLGTSTISVLVGLTGITSLILTRYVRDSREKLISLLKPLHAANSVVGFIGSAVLTALLSYNRTDLICSGAFRAAIFSRLR